MRVIPFQSLSLKSMFDRCKLSKVDRQARTSDVESEMTGKDEKAITYTKEIFTAKAEDAKSEHY